MTLNFMIIGMLMMLFSILVIIGFLTSKNLINLEDYFLGGRKLTTHILSLSFSATGMSGWLFLGFAGLTYETGFQTLWIMIPSSTIGILLCFTLISKRVRIYSEKIGAISIIEIVKKRYYDEKNILTFIIVIIICTAAIAYVSGQLIASGKLLNIILHWNYSFSVLMASIVMITYTALGGFIAVSWTDVIQGIFMVIGSLIALGLAIIYSGGFHNLSFELTQVGQTYPEFITSPSYIGFTGIIMGLSWFIGDGIFNWIGQPTLMVKYMASKDLKTLSYAPIPSILIQICLFTGVFLVSIYMRTQFPEASLLPYSGDTETILIQFFITMTHPIVVGIIVGAIIAAIMSTADSLLMMATSVLVSNAYNIISPNAPQKHLILFSRLTTILLGLIAVMISLNKNSVLALAWFGWTTLGLTGIPIIIGLYWKRATTQGATIGILCGFFVLIIWNVFDLTDKWNIFYALPACSVSYAVTILVSLFTPPPPDHIMREIEDLKQSSNRKHQIEL